MARNECTNPALGANTTGWQDNSGGITRVTVTGFERPQAAEVTVPALDAFERRIISQTGAAAAGATYTGSVSYRTDRDTTSLDVYLIFADSTGALLQKSAHASNPLGSTANTVARAVVTATAPASTAQMAMWVSLDNEPLQTVLQVTAVRLEEGSFATHDYADGETTGWEWDGTRYNSASGEVSSVTVAPTGIASAEAFGSPTISTGPVIVSPSSITSAEAFGTASVSHIVAPSGVASAETFGTPTVTAGAVTVAPSGIASGEAFGTPTVNTGQTVSPTGIASGEAFGTASVTTGAVTISPTGITSSEAFGTAAVTPGAVTVAPAGIASEETFGGAAIGLTISPSGITSGETFGSPAVTAGAVTVAPSGIASSEAFGTATITGGETIAWPPQPGIVTIERAVRPGTVTVKRTVQAGTVSVERAVQLGTVSVEP